MKTYEKIYQLLSEQEDFISGEYLAEQVGLSRTAIWKAMKTLETKGVRIDKLTNRGYRLVEGDLVIPEQLEKSLGFPVFFNPKSASTQIDAKEGIKLHHPTPALYLAPNQKNAYGRFERPFFTPDTGGIYMSLHLKPNLSYQQLPNYTMMVAASIVKAISRLTGIETQIKWVNDIYLGKKKLAGILTEAVTSIETGLVTDLIIGVGLNFFVPDFPESLKNKATSLFFEKPSITREMLITEIWQLFFNIPEKELIKVYKEKSLVLDKRVTFTENNQVYSGVASQITDKGQLLVKLDTGETKQLNGGEISLSSWES